MARKVASDAGKKVLSSATNNPSEVVSNKVNDMISIN